MSLPMLGILFAGSVAHAETGPLPDLQPFLLIQTAATLMDQDNKVIADPGGYGDPEDDFGFKIQRVRLGFEGENDTIKYGVGLGVSSPYDAVEEAQGAKMDVSLVDAYGGYSPLEALWIVGGIQKVPVSRENLMASHQLTFTRRSVPTHWLTPSRDLGVVFDSSWKGLRFRVGAFNGSGDLRGDDNKGKLVAARIEGTFGEADVYQTYGEVDDLTVAVGTDGWLNNETSVESSGLGVDVLLRFKGLAVLAEARLAEAKPKQGLVDVPGVFAETKRQGLMVQAGYTVGSIEPAIRFSSFDDDKSVEDVGDVVEGMGGITWHSEADQVRAGIGYTARIEKGPSKVDNDSIQAWFQLKL